MSFWNMRGFKRILAVSGRRERFLLCYEHERTIAGAARLAGIHRSTIHRWLQETGFREELQKAWQRGHRHWLETEYKAQQEQRKAARERRRLELLPMRRQLAARARAAKKRRRS